MKPSTYMISISSNPQPRHGVPFSEFEHFAVGESGDAAEFLDELSIRGRHGLWLSFHVE